MQHLSSLLNASLSQGDAETVFSAAFNRAEKLISQRKREQSFPVIGTIVHVLVSHMEYLHAECVERFQR